jgi:hypothetical protein
MQHSKGKKSTPGARLNSHFVRELDEAFNTTAWHGTNLKGSLRGLSARQAAWRPDRGRHNIWEIAVHVAYWKYIVYKRLTGFKEGAFPHKGRNWFKLPLDGSEEEWKRDLELLDIMHSALRSAVQMIDFGSIGRRPLTNRFTYEQTAGGIAAHDIYHAGQIQLLRRLHRKQ